MAISSPGIGSNLPVNDIISKLMVAESAPLTQFDKKSASYLAQVSAFGNLSSALGTFQSSLSGLTSLSGFQTMSSLPGDSSIFTATANGTAKPGSYRINVTQIAQPQTLASGGYKSTTAAIGLGAKTTINFALGTVSGGSFGLTGGALGASLSTGGLTPGALSINGTAIATDGTTRSARLLADANITVTGSAADGTLQFTNADGSNIAIAEAVSGTVTGGIGNSGAANIGSSTTAVGAISLVSSDGNPIKVGGTNPEGAGLTAGTGGAYLGANFAANADRTSGNIVIDSTNNTLEGIMAAINKGNFGVTASIVSDGSTGANATPQRLVLTSTASGQSSTMKITLSGSGADPADPALVSLLAYDPKDGGVQNLSQKAAASDTKATVNGIDVTSSSLGISGAIAGVTISALKVGASTVTVSKDTAALNTAVTGFVKAYNELNAQMTTLGGFNPDTKTGGPLLGDNTLRNLQSSIRAQMSKGITGLQDSKLTNLSQIGISFQKDGTLTLDNSKLQKAIENNYNDIAGLFAAVGRSTDSDVSFVSSSAKTQAGDYAVSISQLATKGVLQGSATLPAETIIADDTKWTITLNDTVPANLANTQTVTIPAGRYNPSQLATMLQSSINGVKEFSAAGATVAATVGDDGKLKLESTRYGSKSNITVSTATGTAASTLFGGASPVKGVDVAGTIGGYTATGDGQTLTGAPGAPVDGLKLTVAGETTGSRGTFGFSQGYAYQLNTLASGYLGAQGALTSRTSGLNKTVADITKQREEFSLRLVDIEARYRKQYSALDVLISNMNTTTSFLTQQFAAMAKA